MSGVLQRNIFYTDNEGPPGIINTLFGNCSFPGWIPHDARNWNIRSYFESFIYR